MQQTTLTCADIYHNSYRKIKNNTLYYNYFHINIHAISTINVTECHDNDVTVQSVIECSRLGYYIYFELITCLIMSDLGTKKKRKIKIEPAG